jgi:hypothetical protein
MTTAAADNGAQALAALALIRAYAGRDLYTARHILARWAHGPEDAASFAAVVASSAATVLERVAHGDRDQAERWAAEALEVYQSIRADKLAA